MPEALVETQVRLMLEQQTAVLFKMLWQEDFARHGFTVIAFDFDAPVFNNVAFKTSLTLTDLVDAFESLVGSWLGGLARLAPRGITERHLRRLADKAKASLPAGVGFVVLIGNAEASAYVSSGNREDVCVILQEDLLPRWRADAQS